MYNKKLLSKAISELGKAKAPSKPKDIIKDPRGQWAHPGENTRIPGGDITMDNVPYPVWAQPNVGPGMMMQPGQDYNFPGADYVDEFPQMQSGGHTVKQRRGTRENYDGHSVWTPSGQFSRPSDVSSHLMKAEYVDGRGWVAFPSLFQDSKPYADDSRNWVDMSDEKDGWWPIYEEAEKRGEVYDFGEDKEAALAFGMGSWKDQLPEHLQDKQTGGDIFNQAAYSDSLNLYKAYRMQDRLMGPASFPYTGDDLDWSTRALRDARIPRMVPGLPRPVARDFQSEEEQFAGGWSPASRDEDRQLIDYYRSLGFGDDQIMFHSSPDIASDTIKPIGTYNDGTAASPIYKKPVMTKAMWEAAQTPTLPTRPLEQIPTKEIDTQLIHDKTNNALLELPGSATTWHKSPSTGTWYERERRAQGPSYNIGTSSITKKPFKPTLAQLKMFTNTLQEGGENRFLPKAQTGIFPSRRVPPIEVTRQDSLDLYNNAMQVQGFYDKNKNFYDVEIFPGWRKDNATMKQIEAETMGHSDLSYDNTKIIERNNDPNISYTSDMITGAIDTNAPLLRYDHRIKPEGEIMYTPKNMFGYNRLNKTEGELYDKIHNEPSERNHRLFNYFSKNSPNSDKKDLITYAKSQGFTEKDMKVLLYRQLKQHEVNKNTPGALTKLPYYNPTSIKPWDMKTEEEKELTRNKTSSSSSSSGRALGTIIQPKKSYKAAYKNADKEKYPTIDAFIADAEYYKKNGRNMPAEDLAKVNNVTDYIGNNDAEENQIKSIELLDKDHYTKPVENTGVIYEDDDYTYHAPVGISISNDAEMKKLMERQGADPDYFDIRAGIYRIPKTPTKDTPADTPGTVKPPASTLQWVKHPQTGTWYQIQRPVKPKDLKEYNLSTGSYLQKGGTLNRFIPKAQRGGRRKPIYLTDPNDPRLEGYQDSLTLSNFTKAQEKFERGYPSFIFSPWQYADAEKDPRHHDLQVMANDAVNNNPRIDWSLDLARGPSYEYKVKGDEEWFDEKMPFQRRVQLYSDDGDFRGFESGKLKKGDNIRFGPAFNVWDKLKNNPRTKKVNNPNSPDIAHKTIKPTDWYMGRGVNDIYTPPVQPYIYKEEVEEVEEITDPASAVITPPKPKVTTDPNLSVDVRMRHMNMDPSYANRKRIAAEAGIENYKGTLEQNSLLNQYIVDNYNDQGIKNEAVVVEPTETVQPVIEEVIAPVDSNDIPVSLDMSKPKPEPKTNESGTVKPPASTLEWVKEPVIGWVQRERAVKPEDLESRKIGFLQSGGQNNNYIELDLDENEIQAYKDGGYVVEELPQAQNGTTLSLGPQYNSDDYGLMGNLGLEHEFRGTKDRSNIHTLSGDVYGGNFGFGAKAGYEFGTEQRGSWPAKNFMKQNIGLDPVRGGYYDLSAGHKIHAIKNRQHELNITPYGGMNAQTKAHASATQVFGEDRKEAQLGLNYGIKADYKRKLKNDSILKLNAGVMFNPVLGKKTDTESNNSENLGFRPTFTLGASLGLPVDKRSRQRAEIKRRIKQDKELDSVPSIASISNPKFLEQGGNINQLSSYQTEGEVKAHTRDLERETFDPNDPRIKEYTDTRPMEVVEWDDPKLQRYEDLEKLYAWSQLDNWHRKTDEVYEDPFFNPDRAERDGTKNFDSDASWEKNLDIWKRYDKHLAESYPNDFYDSEYEKQIDDTKGWRGSKSVKKDFASIADMHKFASDEHKREFTYKPQTSHSKTVNEVMQKYPPNSYQARISYNSEPYADTYSHKNKGLTFTPGTGYITNPNTALIENEIDIEKLKAIYPDLTDEEIAKHMEKTRATPNYYIDRAQNYHKDKWNSYVPVSLEGPTESENKSYTLKEIEESNIERGRGYDELRNLNKTAFGKVNHNTRAYVQESEKDDVRRNFNYLPMYDQPKTRYRYDDTIDTLPMRSLEDIEVPVNRELAPMSPDNRMKIPTQGERDKVLKKPVPTSTTEWVYPYPGATQKVPRTRSVTRNVQTTSVPYVDERIGINQPYDIYTGSYLKQTGGTTQFNGKINDEVELTYEEVKALEKQGYVFEKI